MVEMAGLRGEGILDVAKAGFPARLGIQQNRELVPTAELLYVAITLELPDTVFKLMSGNETKKLVKDRVIMSHGSPPSVELSLDNPILVKTKGSFYFSPDRCGPGRLPRVKKRQLARARDVEIEWSSCNP